MAKGESVHSFARQEPGAKNPGSVVESKRMEKWKELWNECKNRPVQAVIGAYLLVLGCGLSLYLYDGYYQISYDKFLFWRKSSLIFMVLLIIALGFMALIARENRSRFHLVRIFRPMDLTDWGMLAYGLFCTVSFFFAVDRNEALWGTYGWQVGWLSQLVMIFWYFAVKKLYRWHRASSWFLLSGAMIVMMIGILQRMGMIEISDGVGEGMYLSTIGNINWYAGYLSVMVPLLFGMFLTSEDHPAYTIGYSLCILTAFLALISNGSDSVYLLLLGVSVMTAVLSLSTLTKFRRFCLILAMFGIAGELIYLYLSHSPAESFLAYNHDNLSMVLTDNHRGLLFAAGAALLYAFGSALHRKKGVIASGKVLETVMKVITVIAVPGVLAFTFAQAYDLLPLKNSWGTSRGVLWRLSAQIYQTFPAYRKLIGVGPDCFHAYISGTKLAKALVDELYGGKILTNAHSEIFTMVMNLGWLGALSFLFMTASSVYESILAYFKEETKDDFSLIRILVIAGVLFEFPEPYSKFPLAIYFTYGKIFVLFCF